MQMLQIVVVNIGHIIDVLSDCWNDVSEQSTVIWVQMGQVLVSCSEFRWSALIPATKCSLKGTGFRVTQQKAYLADTHVFIVQIPLRQIASKIFDQLVKGDAFLLQVTR
jgi:hypothetical protein